MQPFTWPYTLKGFHLLCLVNFLQAMEDHVAFLITVPTTLAIFLTIFILVCIESVFNKLLRLFSLLILGCLVAMGYLFMFSGGIVCPWDQVRPARWWDVPFSLYLSLHTYQSQINAKLAFRPPGLEDRGTFSILWTATYCESMSIAKVAMQSGCMYCITIIIKNENHTSALSLRLSASLMPPWYALPSILPLHSAAPHLAVLSPT